MKKRWTRHLISWSRSESWQNYLFVCGTQQECALERTCSQIAKGATVLSNYAGQAGWARSTRWRPAGSKVDELGIKDNTIVFILNGYSGPHESLAPDAGATPFRGEKTPTGVAHVVPAMGSPIERRTGQCFKWNHAPWTGCRTSVAAAGDRSDQRETYRKVIRRVINV